MPFRGANGRTIGLRQYLAALSTVEKEAKGGLVGLFVFSKEKCLPPHQTNNQSLPPSPSTKLETCTWVTITGPTCELKNGTASSSLRTVKKMLWISPGARVGKVVLYT